MSPSRARSLKLLNSLARRNMGFLCGTLRMRAIGRDFCDSLTHRPCQIRNATNLARDRPDWAFCRHEQSPAPRHIATNARAASAAGSVLTKRRDLRPRSEVNARQAAREDRTRTANRRARKPDSALRARDKRARASEMEYGVAPDSQESVLTFNVRAPRDTSRS